MSHPVSLLCCLHRVYYCVTSAFSLACLLSVPCPQRVKRNTCCSSSFPRSTQGPGNLQGTKDSAWLAGCLGRGLWRGGRAGRPWTIGNFPPVSVCSDAPAVRPPGRPRREARCARLRSRRRPLEGSGARPERVRCPRPGTLVSARGSQPTLLMSVVRVRDQHGRGRRLAGK